MTDDDDEREEEPLTDLLEDDEDADEMTSGGRPASDPGWGPPPESGLGSDTDATATNESPSTDGTGSSADSSPSTEDTAETEPLGDIARRTADIQRDTEEDELFQEAFEDVSVKDVDSESLWDAVESRNLDGVVAESEAESGRNVYVVAKREYCQRCQYFSAPPEVRCDYEGAEIIELDDTEHFRVADCPIVEGVEELGSLEE